MALGDDAVVQLRGQAVDLTGQLGIGLQLQLQLGLDEVVVGLGLLEYRLAVLAFARMSTGRSPRGETTRVSVG